MKKKVIISGVVLLFLFWVSFLFLRLDPIKLTGNVVSDINLTNIVDLGIWIDARVQGSYYADHNSLIRDDSGRIITSYCSSPQPFNQDYAPDWRATANYSTDEIRMQYSDNNGTSWSNASVIVSAGTDDHFWDYNPSWKIQRNWASDGYYWEYSTNYSAWVGYQKDSKSNNGTGWGTIMKTQQNLFQGACSNVLMYYRGKYYIYFESYTPPSGIISIYVARASSANGPYEVWTVDGWKTNPTISTWEPVIKPNIITLAGDEYVADKYQEKGRSPYNVLYGAGLPRGITQKDGKIYLYYIDTTYWFVWKDAQGNVHEYDRNATGQIPYELVAIGNDPTNLTNNYSNRMVNSSGTELWDSFSPRYFPEQNKFYNFMLKEIDGQNKIVYRTSENGIIWSNENILGSAPFNAAISGGAVNSGNNITESFSYLIPISDKNGYGKISDLYLAYYREYLLPNAPVGWLDTPNFRWYYGGTDIYGLKVNVNFTQTVQNQSNTLDEEDIVNSSSLPTEVVSTSNNSNRMIYQTSIQNQNENLSVSSNVPVSISVGYNNTSSDLSGVASEIRNQSGFSNFFKKFICNFLKFFNKHLIC